MSSFFDTNILVYMFDLAEPVKRKQAQALFLSAHADDAIVLSTQVLQEFLVTVTCKLTSSLPYHQALDLLHDYSHLKIIRIEPETIIQAAARAETAVLCFRDALIIEAALDGARSGFTAKTCNTERSSETCRSLILSRHDQHIRPDTLAILGWRITLLIARGVHPLGAP